MLSPKWSDRSGLPGRVSGGVPGGSHIEVQRGVPREMHIHTIMCRCYQYNGTLTRVAEGAHGLVHGWVQGGVPGGGPREGSQEGSLRGPRGSEVVPSSMLKEGLKGKCICIQ